jgi:hypothetical protein
MALLVAGAFAGPAAAYDFCSDLQDCQRKADAEIAAGRYERAADILVAVADFATMGGTRDDQLSAFESLTEVNLKLHKPLMAHAWAQAALLRFEQDPRALANLEHVLPTLSATEPPSTLSGTYLAYAGYGYWSELRAVEQDDGLIRTEWFMLRYGLVPSADAYGPAAFWELTAEARLSDGNLVVRYEGRDGIPCELGFNRKGLAIEWTWPQPDELSSGCRIGGANVLPWGPFWLVDPATPDLAPPN